MISIVNCVVFAPDGASLASGSDDHAVKLWDRASGALLHTFVGHTAGVRTLIFSADGKTLFSAGDDRSIKLWSPATGQEIASLPGHDAPIHALVLLPGDQTLASGSADCTIKLWNLATRTETLTLKGHAVPVRALAVGSNGVLASGVGRQHDQALEPGRRLRTPESASAPRSLDARLHRPRPNARQRRQRWAGARLGPGQRRIARAHSRRTRAPVTALAIHPLAGAHLVSGSRDTLAVSLAGGQAQRG